MRRALTFGLLGIACGYLAWQTRGIVGVVWLSVAWSFLGVSTAYALLRPNLLGKRPNGSFALPSLILWLAYFLLTWLVWFLARLAPRYPHAHQILPELWLGAWPERATRLPIKTQLIVDLTSEFPRRVETPQYLCLPTLDMEAPTLAQLQEGVDAIQNATGPVYVHCAAGHGRSATVVAAVLLARNIAATPEEAEAFLQRIRPGVKLTPPQRRLLESATIRQ